MVHNTVNPTVSPKENPGKEAEPRHKTDDSAMRNEGTDRDPKFEKSLISGIISLILLAVIKKSEEPLYGYSIWKKMKTRKNGRVSLKQGTIYPVLRILQKEGLLESEIRASESGPARKYYWITAKGKGTLEIWTESWHNTRDFVENILGGEADE
jgi:PadR family transcriptional regulator PadR